MNLLLLLIGETPEVPPSVTDETLEVMPEEPAGPDRSRVPEVMPPTVLDLPAPATYTVHPGLDVHVIDAPWSRKLEMELRFHKGRVDLGEGQQTEATRAMGWLWDAATDELDTSAMSQIKDVSGIELWTTSTAHHYTVTLNVPIDELELGLDLLHQVLHTPAWPERELKLYKRDRSLYYNFELPSSLDGLAGEVMGDAWYPAPHPYGVRFDQDGLDALTPGALDELYETLLGTAAVSVTLVTPRPWTELQDQLVEAWGPIGIAADRSTLLADPERSGQRVVAVDLPGQEQASLRVQLNAPARYSDDRSAFAAVNHALNGTFLSRLNRNLREEKGWTYGVRGGYYVSPMAGEVLYQVDVPVDLARKALDEIEAELAKAAEGGITPEELSSRQRDRITRWNQRLETASSARSWYGGMVLYDETLEDRRALLESTLELTLEDCNRVAAEVLGPDATKVWVVVGDRSALEDQLADLEPTWIDATSAALGNW